MISPLPCFCTRAYRFAETRNLQQNMSDSESSAAAPTETPIPAACQAIKADLDKCIKEKGEEACKELMEAFQACLKTAAEAS